MKSHGPLHCSVGFATVWCAQLRYVTRYELWLILLIIQMFKLCDPIQNQFIPLISLTDVFCRLPFNVCFHRFILFIPWVIQSHAIWLPVMYFLITWVSANYPPGHGVFLLFICLLVCCCCLVFPSYFQINVLLGCWSLVIFFQARFQRNVTYSWRQTFLL